MLLHPLTNARLRFPMCGPPAPRTHPRSGAHRRRFHAGLCATLGGSAGRRRSRERSPASARPAPQVVVGYSRALSCLLELGERWSLNTPRMRCKKGRCGLVLHGEGKPGGFRAAATDALLHKSTLMVVSITAFILHSGCITQRCATQWKAQQ